MINLADSFIDSLGLLPKDISAKVNSSLKRFRSNRNQAGLNFEKLQTKDEDLYSIRVNDSYRIICKRINGDEFIFLFVGKHDDAYKWADKHTCSVDVNGVVSIHSAVEPRIKKQDGKVRSRLSVLTDSDFDILHIPAEYRNLLATKVFSKEQLVGFKDNISDGAYWVLEQIIEGEDSDVAIDIYRELFASIILPDINNSRIFDVPSDSLAHIGVPLDLIDVIKDIRTIEHFKRIQSKLPENAVQNLYAFLDGEPIEKLIEKSAKGNKPVVQGDIRGALENAGSKQTVVVVKNDDELDKIFEMPLEKWRIFLHPEQRGIVEANYNGPARVLGGAGTGKTVVVVHRAKELAKKCSSGERILLTTFSRTLADDIHNRLKMICDQELLEHVDVRTFDAVSREYLQKLTNLHIKYDQTDRYNRYISPIRKAWKAAFEETDYHEFSEDFFIAEWRDVFQGQRVNSLQEYLTIPRKGKGNTRLTRDARKHIYEVITAYQTYMKANKWIDIDWAQNLCADLLEENDTLPRYKSILVDECQDFASAAFRLLRALAGDEHSNDLFLAGDSRQRIYNGHSSLSRCGIVVNNRSFQLKTNYRTTREIYDLSLKIQKGYNYDNLDEIPIEKDESVPTKHGEAPIIKGYLDVHEEKQAVLNSLRKRLSAGSPAQNICIVAKTGRIAQTYAKMLAANGIDSLFLSNDQNDDKTIPGIRTATMHRVKGMEFDNVYLVSINADLLPYKKEFDNPDNDNVELSRILKREANLIAVAVTRARNSVWISYYDAPSRLIEKFV